MKAEKKTDREGLVRRGREFYIRRQTPTGETGGKTFQLQGRVKVAEKI